MLVTVQPATLWDKSPEPLSSLLTLPFHLPQASSTILCTPERGLALARPGTAVDLSSARALSRMLAIAPVPLFSFLFLYLAPLPVGHLVDIILVAQVLQSRRGLVVADAGVDLDAASPELLLMLFDLPSAALHLRTHLHTSLSSCRPLGESSVRASFSPSLVLRRGVAAKKTTRWPSIV